MNNEDTDTGASYWRQKYWDEWGKPPEGPGPHDDRGGPAYIPWLEQEAAQLEVERDCLLLAIKHYDLADMLDKDLAEILDMCAKGIVPPYAKRALRTDSTPEDTPISNIQVQP